MIVRQLAAFAGAVAVVVAAFVAPHNAVAQTAAPQSGSGLMAKPVRFVPRSTARTLTEAS